MSILACIDQCAVYQMEQYEKLPQACGMADARNACELACKSEPLARVVNFRTLNSSRVPEIINPKSFVNRSRGLAISAKERVNLKAQNALKEPGYCDGPFPPNAPYPVPSSNKAPQNNIDPSQSCVVRMGDVEDVSLPWIITIGAGALWLGRGLVSGASSFFVVPSTAMLPESDQDKAFKMTR